MMPWPKPKKPPHDGVTFFVKAPIRSSVCAFNVFRLTRTIGDSRVFLNSGYYIPFSVVFQSLLLKHEVKLTFALNALKLPVIGVIKLAKVVTMLSLSASVKFELCLARKVILSVVASSFVSALMTASDCGKTCSKVPSKALTAAVSSITEEFRTSICERTWAPRSEARLTSFGWVWGRARARGRTEKRVVVSRILGTRS